MIRILLFAQLAEMFGTHSLEVEGVEDTDGLVRQLEARDDRLCKQQYAIAVNENIIHGNVELKENDTVALLPPFAGG